MQKNEIEISTGIVFRTILVLLALCFLYLVLDVIALVFIAVIITAAMDPAIDWLQMKKIPRTVGVSGLFLILFLLIGLAGAFLVPPIITQFQDFSQNLPTYFNVSQDSLSHLKVFFENNQINFDPQRIVNNITDSLAGFSGSIFSHTADVFSGFISIIVVFSLAFYMTVEENGIRKFIISVTPDQYKEYAVDLTTRIKEKIGRWMLGQLVLMLIIFILDAIGLSLVGVPYALALAFFAGVMEIIPFIGPTISAIPGIILGFLISPLTGFLAFLVYLISQQLEGNVIVPQIMKKAVGLNPVATIIALLVGLRLDGVMGAILAIPVATAISLAINDFMRLRKA